MARCTGANEQYHGDILECVTTLTLTKPFGTFDEVWGDNVVCRLIHVILAQVRPDVCSSFSSPHLSPILIPPPPALLASFHQGTQPRARVEQSGSG